MKALGMIEVYGYVPAVEALDSALKAANVETAEVSLVRGGLVAVFVTGDVGATKAAIEAASSAAARVGQVISTHVIPRPAEDTARLFRGGCDNDIPPDGKPPSEPPEIREDSEKEDLLSDEVPERAEAAEPERDSENLEPEGDDPAEDPAEAEAEASSLSAAELSEEAIRGMTVAALRSVARTLRVPGMTSQDIRFAKKDELIRAISAYLEQRGG